LKAGEKVTVTMKGSTVTRISAAPGSAKPHVSKTHKA
jgi:antitoxin (DNA-binding transcriptional repressor) of toxin-antitoxin stability system